MKFTGLLFFLCLTSIIKAKNYYFSTQSGDDSRTILQAQNPSTPWKTINKLNSFFSNLKPGDSILFKRGETFFESITISASGTTGNIITIGAYGIGADPIITGLTTITGWTSLGGGLYEKTLASPPTKSLNIVLFNGALQPIGRYPKAGLGDASYLIIDSAACISTLFPASECKICSDKIASISNFVGGEVVHRTYQWLTDRGTVTAQTSNRIDFNSIPAPFAYEVHAYAPVSGNGFFFQNHINTLTVLGKCAYNQTTKKITM